MDHKSATIEPVMLPWRHQAWDVRLEVVADDGVDILQDISFLGRGSRRLHQPRFFVSCQIYWHEVSSTSFHIHLPCTAFMDPTWSNLRDASTTVFVLRSRWKVHWFLAGGAFQNPSESSGNNPLLCSSCHVRSFGEFLLADSQTQGMPRFTTLDGKGLKNQASRHLSTPVKCHK